MGICWWRKLLLLLGLEREVQRSGAAALIDHRDGLARFRHEELNGLVKCDGHVGDVGRLMFAVEGGWGGRGFGMVTAAAAATIGRCRGIEVTGTCRGRWVGLVMGRNGTGIGAGMLGAVVGILLFGVGGGDGGRDRG